MRIDAVLGGMGLFVVAALGLVGCAEIPFLLLLSRGDGSSCRTLDIRLEAVWGEPHRGESRTISSSRYSNAAEHNGDAADSARRFLQPDRDGGLSGRLALRRGRAEAGECC